MNQDLGKTQITAAIRVSSAAIFREEHFGKYWLVETWIFSDDPRQKSRQIIHGTTSDNSLKNSGLIERAREVHKKISNNLKSLYQTNEPHTH